MNPLRYALGYDFYAGGQALSFGNMAYQCFRAFEGDEFLQDILSAYLRFMRAPTQSSFDGFWDNLHSLQQDVRKPESAQLLDYMMLGRHLGFKHVADLGQRPTDIAISSLFRLLIHWGERFPSGFCVVYDASKNIDSMKWMVEALAEPTIAETTVGYDIETAYKLPLRVSAFSFAASENTPELQIADFLAGSIATIARAIADRRNLNFALEIAKTDIESRVVSTVWPEMDPNKIVRRRPAPAEGMQDPLEAIGRAFANYESRKSNL